MLDLLLIHPGAAHGIYGELGNTLVAVEPPVWCRIIAAYCRDRGHTVSILDAEALGLSPDTVAERVAAASPRLAVLAVYGHQPSASTQQMHGAGLTATAIRRRCGVPIMMVGGHPSALPQRTLVEEDVDYVGVGEGVVTIDEILRQGATGGVPGLVWWRNNVVTSNKPAPLVEDMSQMNGNAWDLLPMYAYRAHNWQCFGDLDSRKPYASIHTSLGCPYKCSFCCINAPFNSNRYRTRDPLHVVEEIANLYHRYGVRTFKIVDEMFVLKEKHYTDIARALVRTGFADDINIWAYARVDTVRTGHLSLLRNAGIRWLALGIESASAHVRDGAAKAMKNSDIEGVVRAIQSAGINVIGNYIFGLPDDDMASMRSTLDLAKTLNTEFANFYSAMAYPGSPLYAQAVRTRAVLPKTWRGYSQHNDDCRPMDTLHVGGAEVLRFRDAAFDEYFSSPAYVDMVTKKFGAETRDHVLSMTGYKLKRNLLET